MQHNPCMHGNRKKKVVCEFLTHSCDLYEFDSWGVLVFKSYWQPYLDISQTTFCEVCKKAAAKSIQNYKTSWIKFIQITVRCFALGTNTKFGVLLSMVFCMGILGCRFLSDLDIGLCTIKNVPIEIINIAFQTTQNKQESSIKITCWAVRIKLWWIEIQ